MPGPRNLEALTRSFEPFMARALFSLDGAAEQMLNVIALPRIRLSSRCLVHHPLYYLTCQRNFFRHERGVNKEHKARLTECAGDGKPFCRPHFIGKCLLHIDFAATSGVTRNSVSNDLREDAITVPASAKHVGSDKHIILAIGVTALISSRPKYSQDAGASGEAADEDLRSCVETIEFTSSCPPAVSQVTS